MQLATLRKTIAARHPVAGIRIRDCALWTVRRQEWRIQYIRVVAQAHEPQRDHLDDHGG